MGVKIFIKKPLKLIDVQNCKEYLSNNNIYENFIKSDGLNSTNNENLVGLFENNNFKDKYLD